MGRLRATESAPTRYRPRRPSESVLYRCVQEQFETWLAQCRDGHDDEGSVPEYVEREFRRYLACGILAHGFARARCGHDFLIAFSCQGRGVCPSCNTRRMVATAPDLADHVLPNLPLRPWVPAVPKRLRYFVEREADLQGAALRRFLPAVEACLRAHSPGSGPAARLGAAALIHRFGSTLNAHLHLHCAVIDGVFEPAPTDGVVFHDATGLDATATGLDAAAIAQAQAQVCAGGCCATAPGRPSPWTGCANSIPSTSSTTPRSGAPEAVARRSRRRCSYSTASPLSSRHHAFTAIATPAC